METIGAPAVDLEVDVWKEEVLVVIGPTVVVWKVLLMAFIKFKLNFYFVVNPAKQI